MSFLTPLYIAGIAAVSLPILFHMIRRTPRGRIPFSTVMFLDPSPPRMTRRSRLDNWPLLLLRALALTLLAIAFARPFWRSAVGINVDADNGRKIAILLDTSASMRRGGLWDEAVESADKLVEESTPADRIGLFTFDRQPTEIIGFDEWSTLPSDARKKLFRKRIREIQPGWAATHVGQALKTIAETLVAADAERSNRRSPQQSEIVLISDMQVGSQTEPLGVFQWPADVRLTLQQVAPSKTTNAGLQLAADERASAANDTTIRMRVVNASDSTNEQFQLRWRGDGPFYLTAKPIDVYVPAGGSRIVQVPVDANLPTAPQLVLTGDDHDFDNTIAVDRPKTQALNVLFVGNDAADDPNGLRYYVERAFPSTGQRKVTVVGQPADGPSLAVNATDVTLVIVTVPLKQSQLESMRKHAEAGSSLLFVATSPELIRSFGDVIGKNNLQAREAEVEGYAMWGDIDFDHSLFASFKEARFADFTSIHFWKYRQIETDELQGCRVLARFDHGAPAIVTKPLGRGSVTLLTSGWHPADSQLALSTKFVPLMNALLEMSAGRHDGRHHYTVGDAVPIASRTQRQHEGVVVHGPNQQTIQLATGQRMFTETVTPGLYQVADSRDLPRFAVQLAADESRTAPMSPDELESLGVPLELPETAETKEAAERRERQLKAAELEGQQKFWQWLILSAVLALVAETWLAGRMTKSPQAVAADGADA